MIEKLEQDFSGFPETRSAVKYKKQIETKRTEAIKSENRRRAMSFADLHVLKWSWGETAGGSYVEARGLVKNISGKPLRNVEAVIEWFDKNDQFITSQTALIDYNPILPGQESPFKALETYNPAMHSARLRFMLLGGMSLTAYIDITQCNKYFPI